MRQAGILCEVLPCDVDETVDGFTPPDETVRIVSERKAEFACKIVAERNANCAREINAGWKVEFEKEFVSGRNAECTREIVAERKTECAQHVPAKWFDSPYVIITADTTVYIDGRVLGKPSDKNEAFDMLRLLQGRKHTVYSGVTLLIFDLNNDVFQYKCTCHPGLAPESPKFNQVLGIPDQARDDDNETHPNNVTEPTVYKKTTFVETADVYMRALTDAEIHAYIATGEPMDKAGAYGIQEKGATLIERVEGDYFTVVGLPLARLCTQLKLFGVDIMEDWV